MPPFPVLEKKKSSGYKFVGLPINDSRRGPGVHRRQEHIDPLHEFGLLGIGRISRWSHLSREPWSNTSVTASVQTARALETGPALPPRRPPIY